MKIVLLEDDYTLSNEIKKFFDSKSIFCNCIDDGLLFMDLFHSAGFDLVILDVNVPGINGIEICRKIRAENKTIPIIMLTAMGMLEDKLVAFENGANDYVIKPFHFEELLARVYSLTRSTEVNEDDQEFYKIADLEIYTKNSKVLRGGQEISLTPKEFKLLFILAKEKGDCVSKNDIASKLWDYHIETNQNTIEVYVNFLRKKIDKDFEKKLIHTKVGYGYYLKENEIKN